MGSRQSANERIFVNNSIQILILFAFVMASASRAMANSDVSDWLFDAFDLSQKSYYYSDQISLLTGWEVVRDDQVTHIPDYDRRSQFGSWRLIDGCHDTRAFVLIRDDDDGEVERSPRWNCHVVKGQWLDPYTGDWIYRAPQAHIDHVVPLKNAYDSGAWRWSDEKRCHYANFMENDFHLLTVSAFENRSKGERAPDEYMPDDVSFHCDYARLWLSIKKIWNLKVFESEYAAILKLYSSGQCSAKSAKISRSTLIRQRYLATQIPDHCKDVH